MNILEKIKKERVYFDGGYGTNLQKAGLMPGELPELWNMKKPEIITGLHKDYLEAGCDILKTNTFGANILKFSEDELENIIKAAVENAKKAISDGGYKDKYVALDIGPTGKLLKPLGDLDFEEAVEIFARTVRIGVKYGVDLVLIETMNDSLETKAAVLAVKENSDLPVFVTNAYDENQKLMTGASPSAMVALLEGLRVDALGVNCSLGPDKMLPVVKEITENASIPVIVNPNAGLPIIKDGRTEFDVSAESFAKSMEEIAKLGARVLGGCCGTTPEYIKKTKENLGEMELVPIEEKNKTVVSSYNHTVEFGEKPILIGERINPTGKKLLKEALREKNYEYILKEGIGQEDAGADILDVNAGLPEIDEKEVLKDLVKLLQSVSDLPLQIDTSNTDAMEASLRIYNGKPLINSVNGKKESMEEIFPLAKKYGGVVICLTLDETGIPETIEGRMEIAEKIIKTAQEYGISKNDLIFDPLCMTISSDTKSALVTLGCIKELRKMGIKTSLGVSNVSFGLPKRSIVNSTFFAMALASGLDAAIMNPYSAEMMDVYYSFCALSNLDSMCENYISYASKEEEKTEVKPQNQEISACDGLIRAVLKGLKEEAESYTKELLLTEEPLSIIDKCIIPALDEMGSKFENKKAFLPQLLMSAESAKSAFDVIKSAMITSGKDREKKYKIVLATVKGDIHDIGKNIVKVLLENYDFEVIDLGKDVEPQTIVDTAKKENAKLIGLSALMTTTVPAMEETIKLARKECGDVKIAVGGAVLTQEYSDMIGADKYAKDAMEAVRYAESLI